MGPFSFTFVVSFALSFAPPGAKGYIGGIPIKNALTHARFYTDDAREIAQQYLHSRGERAEDTLGKNSTFAALHDELGWEIDRIS